MRLVPSSARGRTSGFTLVEVIAAIALLTIIVGGIVAAQTTAMDLTRSAQETSAATADAEAALEEILVLPIDDIPGEYPSGTAIPRWNNAHLTDQVFTPTYPGLNGLQVPNPLEIRIAVTWRDFRGRNRTLELETVKSR
ncbi:MAG: prepilin-type N-terminal cleavage/methylation domain-containing protein [Planctomycetota bacterium]